MSELFKFKCSLCSKFYYEIYNKGEYTSTCYLEDWDYNYSDASYCGRCTTFPNFTLEHDKFSDSDIELLKYISKNSYNINKIFNKNEKRKNEIKELREQLEQSNSIVEQLQKQIEALRVAHEALLDTFRGYDK